MKKPIKVIKKATPALASRIRITDSIDSRSFRRLMDYHSIKITHINPSPYDDTYTVAASPEKIEDILIETTLRWHFAS